MFNSVSLPGTLALTPSRPSFLFGFNNTFSTDMYVIGIEAPGKVAAMLNTPHTIKAFVQNTGTATINNAVINLNVSGANTFVSSQTITLMPGGTALVSFAAFNPTIAGINTISVSVPSDQNNANNSQTYTQLVTCNEWAQNPPVGNYTVNSVGYGSGSGIIGTPFTAPANALLAGINGAISLNSGNVNQQMYALLVNSSGAIMATSTPVVLTSTMLGTFQTFTFTNPPALTSGTMYYLCLAQTLGTTAWSPFGTLSSYYVPQNMIYYSSLSAGFMSILAPNYGYFGIEAVFVPDVVSATSSPTAICTGSSAIITATGIATSYTWSPGGANTSTISVNPTSSSVFTVAGSFSNTCSSTATVNLIVMQLPNVTATSNFSAVCLGGTVALFAGGAASYTWDSGATTQSTAVTPPATTVYMVTGQTAAGCENTNTVQVTVNSFTPSISSPTTTVCYGKTATLIAGGGQSYLWSNGLPFASISVTPVANTTYSVDATDINGCKGSSSILVSVNPLPVVTATANRTTICKGEPVTLTAGGASTYSWGSGATTASITFTIGIALPSTYTVTGIDNNGCVASKTVTVQVNQCTGISEGSTRMTSVYPNPGHDLVHITMQNVGEGMQVEVVNALGMLVKQIQVTSGDTTIDLAGQPAGLYIINVKQYHEVLSATRFIKQ
jgi:hypothetical protein